jgi:hypothetical protein
MKKETSVAIFLGLLFGAILAIFISMESKDLELSKNKVIAPPKEKTVTTNQNAFEMQPLELSEPVDNVIVTTNSIHFKGTAPKDSLIIIQSPLSETIIKNLKSKFDLEFPLAMGENSIKMVVYPKEKQFRPQEKFIKVYFIDSEL